MTKKTPNQNPARAPWHLLFLFLLGHLTTLPAHSQSAFSFQGRLTDESGPATGLYDLQFTLHDADTNGLAIGPVLTHADVPVSAGLFTVALDFGAQAYDGSPRWLELAVRTNGAADFTLLSPRQSVLPSPMTLFAQHAATATTASNLAGQVPDSQLAPNIARLDGDQTFTGTVSFENGANQFAGDGAGLTNLNLTALNSDGAIAVAGPTFIGSSVNLGVPGEAVATADFNGNGRPDLAVVCPNAARIVVLTNGGGMNWGVFHTINDGNAYRVAKAADMDNDGDQDLVCAMRSGSTSRIFINQGNGTFNYGPSVNGSWSCALADLNGDGRVDIVTAPGSSAVVHTNRGNLQFIQVASLAVYGGTSDVAFDDLNGDGHPDLVALNSSGAQAVVYRNQGNAQFVLGGRFGVGNIPTTAAIADLNRDGRPDVVTANLGNGTLTVLTNDGTGQLFRALDQPVGGGTGGTFNFTVRAARLDQDDYPDLVCNFATSPNLFVFLNNRQGGFAPAVPLYVSALAYDVLAEDLDLDGRVDLVSPIPAQLRLAFHQTQSSVQFTGAFAGDGASLTNVNASSLTSGTLAEARLSGNVALRNANQTFTGTNVFVHPYNYFHGLFDGNGADLTSLNAAALASGTVPDARLGTNVALVSGDVTFRGDVNAWGDLAGTRLRVGIAHTVVPFDATIAGGEFHAVLSDSYGATISGGDRHSIGELSANATISGGREHQIGTNSQNSTIGGGWYNRILNVAMDSTIGGGYANAIASEANGGTIAGGRSNTILDDSLQSTIGGGYINTIEPVATSVTIAGGHQNTVQRGAVGATIGGGEFNTVGTNALFATVVGGGGNRVASQARGAIVLGGEANVAGGRYSLAAGFRAHAAHVGSFVWADSTDRELASAADDSVTFRASGGTAFYSDTNGTAGVWLQPGATSWSSLSDRNVKKDVQSVDSRAVLDKLSAVPVQQWRYQWEASDAVPHLGPMAQDFKAAFYPGRDDKTITTQEIDGVALAAIQGLNQIVREKEQRIRDLEATVGSLKVLVETLIQQTAAAQAQ